MDTSPGQMSHCPHVPSGPCPLREADGGSGCAACRRTQRIQILRRGDYLFAQGEVSRSLHAVLRGLIALEYFDDAGGIAILGLARCGELLGCADLFDGREHRTSARVLEDAVVCTLSESAAVEAIEAGGPFALRLVRAAAAEGHALGVFAQRMASLPVEARILVLIEEFASGRSVFTLPVTKKDLAFMAGTAPEVLSRCLMKLQRQGALVIEGNVVSRVHPPMARPKELVAV